MPDQQCAGEMDRIQTAQWAWSEIPIPVTKRDGKRDHWKSDWNKLICPARDMPLEVIDERVHGRGMHAFDPPSSAEGGHDLNARNL
jgi:hypothetical protein